MEEERRARGHRTTPQTDKEQGRLITFSVACRRGRAMGKLVSPVTSQNDITEKMHTDFSRGRVDPLGPVRFSWFMKQQTTLAMHYEIKGSFALLEQHSQAHA